MSIQNNTTSKRAAPIPANSSSSAATGGPQSQRVAAAPTARNVGHRGGPIATLMLICGIILLILWGVVMLMQISTNEAFITGTSTAVNAFTPNLNLFLQIPNLVSGALSQRDALAALYGWGIEVMVLGLTVGYEIIHSAFHQSSPLMARIFRFLAIVSVLLNGYSDFNYGSIGSGFLGHLLFAAFCSSAVATFGIAGATLLRASFNNA